MNCAHLRRARSNGRHGLVAVNEILIVVAILAAMFWMVSQFMRTVTTEVSAAKSISEGCSDRCVYRISLVQDQQRLWIYRPRDGLMQLNLATNEVIQSIPLSMELSAVSHSRDGLTSIMCGFDGTIVLSRRGKSPLVAYSENQRDTFVDAAVSHNGETAVCCSRHGHVYGWNRQDTEFSYQLPNGSNVMKIGLNSSGDRMYVGRHDGTVLFLDLVTGVAKSPEFRVDPSTTPECFTYALSEDEQLLAAVFADNRTRPSASNRIRVFGVAAGNLVLDVTFKGDGTVGRPTTVVFSEDGRRLAVATCSTPTIQVWEVESGKLAGELRGHKGIVRSLQFADADRLYSGSYDGTVREWSLETWSQSRLVD